MTKKPISELVTELENATEHHRTKKKEADAAAIVACDALSALNNAQKRLDEAIEDLKKNAHYESDWKRP